MARSMRTMAAAFTAAALLCGRGAPAQTLPSPSQESCALDVVEALGDAGEWLTVPSYGPAWRPQEALVGAEFVPFVTGGSWVLRNGQQYFASRWLWGDVVFTSGRWTLNAKEGWVWIPDQRCIMRSQAAAQDDDPMPLPPLLDPTKIRTIKHPLGTQYAYPYGQEWGRVFPQGVTIAAPRWIAPMPTTPNMLVDRGFVRGY
jgi:hypothetical protein